MPDHDDGILITDIRPKTPHAWKSATEVDLTRPRTSNGAPRYSPQHEMPALPWIRSKSRTSLAMSRSTDVLPLDTRPLTKPEYEEVGLAVGSPSELQQYRLPRPAFRPPIDYEPANEPLPQAWAHTEPQTKVSRPSFKRWKTVSGLFSRKKSRTPTPPPLIRVSEDSLQSQSTQDSTDVLPRSSTLFRRKSRPSTAANTPDLRVNSKSPLRTPIPGDARAFEAGDDLNSPQLDITIPQSNFDRYSVMFSKLLRSTGGRATSSEMNNDRLVDTRPPTIPGMDKPEKDDGIREEAQFCRQNGSLASVGPDIRASALPAPLFANTKQAQDQEEDSKTTPKASWFARSSMHDMDAIQESEALPDGVEDWALGKSSEDHGFEKYSRRWSIDSYSTSAAPSPSITSSGWCTPTRSKQQRQSVLFPLTDFPTPPRGPAAKRSESLQHLSIPSPSKRTSWDASEQSPLCRPHSASPRMKFGYDEPKSPLVSYATSVTVCMQTAQAYRPHLVVRQQEHSRQASCSGVVA